MYGECFFFSIPMFKCYVFNIIQSQYSVAMTFLVSIERRERERESENEREKWKIAQRIVSDYPADNIRRSAKFMNG